MNQPETAVDRIPLTRSVHYAVRGMPEVPNQYGPGVLAPSEITITYRDATDSQLGRIHAYVAGRIWVDGKELPLLPGGLYGQHYFDGLDGWPEWLAEEARLHEPAVSSAGQAPATNHTDPDPVCKDAEGCHRVVACDPGCGASGDLLARATDTTPSRRTALRDRIAAAREQLRGMALSLATGSGPLVEPRAFDAALDEYRDAVLAVLPEPADRAAVHTPAEPFPIWTVWREEQPAYGHFATEDIAKQASIDCWEEDDPVCPEYSWRPDGGPGDWELLAGDERAEVYIRRHLVYGGLPQPPRAAVLREAADAVFALDYDVMVGEEGDENLGSMREAWDVGTIHASQLLRRLADETPATQTHACDNCDGIDPDTCINNPHRPPEQCPRSEFDGYGLQCQKPAGHNLCTFEEQPAAGQGQDGAQPGLRERHRTAWAALTPAEQAARLAELDADEPAAGQGQDGAES